MCCDTGLQVEDPELRVASLGPCVDEPAVVRREIESE